MQPTRKGIGIAILIALLVLALIIALTHPDLGLQVRMRLGSLTNLKDTLLQIYLWSTPLWTFLIYMELRTHRPRR